MKTIYFATSNKNKVEEVKKILGFPIGIASIELDEIQDLDIRKIATAKVIAAYKQVKKPVFIDDVSFEVDAWNGFPGPFIKFVYLAGDKTYDLLLKMLKNEKNRRFKATAIIAYHDGRKVHLFEGSVEGNIALSRGEKGWGFDAYVIPDGYDKNLGDLGDIKNKISHRGMALAEFKKFLDSQSK